MPFAFAIGALLSTRLVERWLVATRRWTLFAWAALGTLQAGKNAYTIEDQVSNEVGIRSDLLTAEDLFVIAEQIDPDGSVYFRVFVKPLVNLIWIAGAVFLLGSVIALRPDRREQRRLVARTAQAGSPATR